MRKLVIATTNSNKVKRLSALLSGKDLEILSLNDFDIDFGEPDESLGSPEAIAAQKALHYVSMLPKGTLVLTQDDTLTFDNVSPEDNPGLHIKQPVIDKFGEFTDEDAAKYYSGLAKKYNGKIDIVFHYGHALAVAGDDNRNTIKLAASTSRLEAKMVEKVNKLETVPGYFMSALMTVKIDSKDVYYNDLDDGQLVKSDADLQMSILSLFEKIGVEL
jgi:hypothetical protein